MRGFGILAAGFCALWCAGCTGDTEVLATCQDMSEHRRDCGFTDDGVWCQELASYKMSEAQRATVFCVLDCYRQVDCDEIALEVCADLRDRPAEDCARPCGALSDLWFIPPAPAVCEETSSE